MRAKLTWVLPVALLLAAAVGAPTASPDESPAAISQIRHEATDTSTRVVVECTAPLAYTYYSPDPLTLVVDIPDVDPTRAGSRVEVGTREVEAITVSAKPGEGGRRLARLEVKLASPSRHRLFSKDRQLNLVFERLGEPASASAAAPVEAAPTAETPAEAAAEKPAADAPAEAPAAAAAEAPAAPAAAPETDLPEPIASDLPLRPATRIFAVLPGYEEGDVALTVRADGALRYQDFFLGNPDRLVLDFSGVTSRPVKGLEVARAPVRRVRLAQFSTANPKVARLVLDLTERSPYRIVEARDGLKIVFGEGGDTPKPAPLAALKPAPMADTPPPAPVTTSVAAVEPAPLPAPMAPLPPAAPEPQAGEGVVVGQAGVAKTVITTGEKQYTGHPISLDFKDGDLQDIFRLFADISGLNIVVNPGVGGKVTLKLNEVPWDQALDLILKANGLGYTLEGNVIRIARLSDLQREEQERRKLAEEKQLAGDLGSLTARISYARASELSDVLRRANVISSRGTINVDTRTNTMLINDLPNFLERAQALIAELDRPTPQVEIEARIVVTSRNFTRDLGIQWGFLNRQTPQFGNTTGQNFPNAIIINGQGVPSQGGIPADQGAAGAGSGIGTPGRGYMVNLPAAGFNTGIGISLGNILGSFNLDVALTALERQGRGRLLSTPKVTTQNNQAAEIKQGVQIPIQTVANNTVTVQFKDAVLTLKVTPQITEAGTVILNLEVENNAADFANLVNGIPPINTQSAKTQVLVKDGATAVIGGIYQSNEQTSQQSTPFLGRIPLLGYLFRNRFVTNTNNELLLFITPRIIKG
jgi:type IV pilus assembly protein PilQ